MPCHHGTRHGAGMSATAVCRVRHPAARGDYASVVTAELSGLHGASGRNPVPNAEAKTNFLDRLAPAEPDRSFTKLGDDLFGFVVLSTHSFLLVEAGRADWRHDLETARLFPSAVIST